jgi:hypothetical protein
VGVPVGEFVQSFDEVGWIPQFQSRFLAEFFDFSPNFSIPVPIPQFQSQFQSQFCGGWSSLSEVVCVGPLLVTSLLVGIVPLVLS